MEITGFSYSLSFFPSLSSSIDSTHSLSVTSNHVHGLASRGSCSYKNKSPRRAINNRNLQKPRVKNVVRTPRVSLLSSREHRRSSKQKKKEKTKKNAAPDGDFLSVAVKILSIFSIHSLELFLKNLQYLGRAIKRCHATWYIFLLQKTRFRTRTSS